MVGCTLAQIRHYKAHVRIDKLEVRKLSLFPLRFVHMPQSGHVVKARLFHNDNGGPGYLGWGTLQYTTANQ